MPIYCWHDKNSELKVEVIRSFAEYENPPVDDELPEAERGKQDSRKWERIIGSDIRVMRGAGWGMGKGYWIQLIGIIGLAAHSYLSRLI